MADEENAASLGQSEEVTNQIGTDNTKERTPEESPSMPVTENTEQTEDVETSPEKDIRNRTPEESSSFPTTDKTERTPEEELSQERTPAESSSMPYSEKTEVTATDDYTPERKVEETQKETSSPKSTSQAQSPRSVGARTPEKSDTDQKGVNSPREQSARSTDNKTPPQTEQKTKTPTPREQTPAQANETEDSSETRTKTPPTSQAMPTTQASSTTEPSKTTAESTDTTSGPTQPSIPVPPPLVKAETDSGEKAAPNALNLIWSFGLNKHIPVLNLTDNKGRRSIMYACAHTGIMYNFRENKQTLLQGHSNAISCTCVSNDKRWLATADKGFDNMIIVWDTYTGMPVRTLFDPHPDGGTLAIAMTPDAKYLATISNEEKQTMAIWDWTVEGETPLGTADLNPSYGRQNYVYFNPEDITQVVSNSDTQVIFYSWRVQLKVRKAPPLKSRVKKPLIVRSCVMNKLDDPNKKDVVENIEYFAPPLTDEDFNKPVGKYSHSIFLSNSGRALTGTFLGNLVVWDTNKPLTKVDVNEVTPDKKALKIVKLQDKGISVLTTSGQFIVTGDTGGLVKFYDQTLKLMNWYQDFNLGPVNSVSFTFTEPPPKRRPDSRYPNDCTIQAKQFAVREFVVGTSTNVCGYVKTDNTEVRVLLRDNDAPVHAIVAHPCLPFLLVGSYSGLLKVWNYEKRDVYVSRHFERGREMIRCVNYNPTGNFIGIGFLNGVVKIVDGISLTDVAGPFRYARDAITHIEFSHDSQYMATADAEYTITVFKYNEEEDGSLVWSYLGRHRAHYKLIHDIMFGVQLDSDEPRLLSLGEDRVLVEYDLENSIQDDLKVLSSDRIEQSAVPMCMAWYPPITKESFIVTANTQFKFKLYNSTTKMCRQTYLGPTYGTPLQKIAILPGSQDPNKRYMGYITKDKVGLNILPLDGNPHNAIALIAHPQGVSNLTCSFDGKYIFTSGGTDHVCHMWEVNTVALEAQRKLGGDDLIPFYGLLEGGREGELFKELEDFFYYAQLRSQGIDTMDTRKVSTKIPLSEVPFVMRAMGFYPTEQEIEDMLNEVKYSEYVETGEYITEIDLGTFIRLYTNHRPTFGLEIEKLTWAFETLGHNNNKGETILHRGDLLDLLQSKGEHMTEYELAEYLTTLIGSNELGGTSELEEFDPSTAGDVIEENLPQAFTTELFANDLLGFGMYSDVLNVEEVDSQQAIATPAN